MMIQVHSTIVPCIENKSKRIFRIRAEQCYLQANWFGSECMNEHQKSIFENLPVSLCILSKFDDREIINETYQSFYDAYKLDSEELYGVIKYFKTPNPHVRLTMLVCQRSLNMCRYGVNKVVSGSSPGFILHLCTRPDLRSKSRNQPFDFEDFISGTHYFIEDVNYQILKEG